jgi:hypothetical protein
MKGLLKQINVWKRINRGKVACYRCFELAGSATARFCVQSKDTYWWRPFFSSSIMEQQDFFDRQFIGLICEESPESRGAGMYETLEDAIRAFDKDFNSKDPSIPRTLNTLYRPRLRATSQSLRDRSPKKRK